jgi:hypothetical protein
MTFAANLAQSASNNVTMRNRLINGGMVIDQRNAGASVTPANNQYTLDRYIAYLTQSSKFTVQQNAGSVTPPAGFTNYLGVTSSSAYSVTSSDFFGVAQYIEGFNTADLNFGTANAQPVTLSFWVRSSLTGTFASSISNNNFDRSYPYTYTINSANTWEYKTITIPGDTAGTWVGATNGLGLRVYFNIGAGSNYTGTAGAWAGSGLLTTAGAVSVVGTSGATFYFTGVQLEEGTAASPFEYRLITTELQLCQRYFFKQTYQQANTRFGTGLGEGGTSINGILINLPVSMRTIPTNAINAIGVYDGTTAQNLTALTTNFSSPLLFSQEATTGVAVTAGKVVQLYATGTTAFVSSSAEL